MLLVSYIQQYFDSSITVLTNQVWKLLIALFSAEVYIRRSFNETNRENRVNARALGVSRVAFSILAWISYFNLCFILDCDRIQYRSHLVRTTELYTLYATLHSSAEWHCTTYSVYSVSLVYCTYAWTNRGPICKINRGRIDVWTNHGPIGEIHRWYICLQLCIIHDLHAFERGSRAGKKKYRKGLAAEPLAVAFTRGLAISPYRQLVSSKSLCGVENNLRHEALSKGYKYWCSYGTLE